MLVLTCIFDGEEKEITMDAEWMGEYILKQLNYWGDRFIVKSIRLQ